MVNTIAPFGVQDLNRRDGGSPTYGLTKVLISSTDATPIFHGDLVQNLPTAPGSGGFGEYITQASSGLNGSNAAWRGIFRGCEYLNTAVGRVVWSENFPATGVSSQADPIAYIQDDPGMLYLIQATSAAVIGSSNVGQNCQITANASTGNATSGISGIQLASSTAPSSTSTLPFRIRDFYSNYAPPGGFVNGTDNANPGQIIVVAPNNFVTNVTAGSSS